MSHLIACGILIPWQEIEPMPPAVEECSTNHWTPREFPEVSAFKCEAHRLHASLRKGMESWWALWMNLIQCHFVTHLLRGFPFSLVRTTQVDRDVSEWPELQLCPQRLGPPPTHWVITGRKSALNWAKEQSSAMTFPRQQRNLRSHQPSEFGQDSSYVPSAMEARVS